MTRSGAALVVGVLAVLGEAPVPAHHSFSAEYDQARPVVINGTVARVEWTNPHVWLYVDAKEATGTVTTWAFELKNPGVLTRVGWTRKSLKPGDGVTVMGFAAKNGLPAANVSAVVLSDTGQRLFDIANEGNPP